MAAAYDVVFPEVLDSRRRGTAAVHHDEICPGIDHSNHPRVCFVEELLPVVFIASQAGSDVIGIGERNPRRHRRYDTHTIRELVEASSRSVSGAATA